MEERIQDGGPHELGGFYASSELLERFSNQVQSLIGAADRAAANGNPEGQFAALLALESVLLSDLLNEQEALDLVSRPEMQAAIKTSQRIFAAFESRLEDAFVADIAGVKAPQRYLSDCDSITRNYLARYRALAAAEVALARVGPADRVAFVGAGALPITALEYIRTTGCHVDGIEILGERAAAAEAVIDRLGFGGRLTMINADGRTIDFSDYSVILVGVLAEPKTAIFAKLAGTAAPEARVICRTTEGLRQLIYKPTAAESLLPYKAQAINRARGFQTLSTLRLGRLTLNPGDVG